MYNKYGEDTNHKENAVNVSYNNHTESRGPSAQEKTWCNLTKCVVMRKTPAGRNIVLMGFGSAPWAVAEPWPSPMGWAGDGLGRAGPEGSWVMGRNIFKVFSPFKPSPEPELTI